MKKTPRSNCILVNPVLIRDETIFSASVFKRFPKARTAYMGRTDVEVGSIDIIKDSVTIANLYIKYRQKTDFDLTAFIRGMCRIMNYAQENGLNVYLPHFFKHYNHEILERLGRFMREYFPCYTIQVKLIPYRPLKGDKDGQLSLLL